MDTAHPPIDSVAVVDAALDDARDVPGALLPVLHAVQDRLGFVPPAAVRVIGKALNLSRAEVHGVITFYPHFRTTKPGLHVVQICRAEACQSMGADDLVAHVTRVLGIELHATTADGRFTLEPVHCLGNCACSPAVMIDDDLHGRVTVSKFDALIQSLKAPA